jgi:hypothetical protein
MSRRGWIIVLIAAGIGLAILIGVLGTRNEPSQTKAEATAGLCTSLQGLDSSLKTLTSLDPGTATADELNTDVSAVQSSWNTVKSSAQDVQNASMGSLDSAWDSFSSAVKDIPNASSVSDAVTSVQQAGQQLESTAKSTASSINCTSSSSSS